MKIVIAGAGEVGTHLAKKLSRENHDIFLIDENKDKLNRIEQMFEVSTVEGSPSSIRDLKEVESHKADLFIAVTPDESQNITACILAHKLGAKKVFARINNYEYLIPENKEFFNQLGIDALIYPELLAAKEITNSIKMNWVRQWMEFSNGALTLIGMKVRSNAPIINQRLMDLKNSNFYRIVAIRRNSETIIPKGADIVLANDIVYFITTKDYVSDVRTQAGKEVIDVKDILFMGGGKITHKTVNYLPKDIDIKIVEKEQSRINVLMDDEDIEISAHTMIVKGDARDMDFLKDAGIENSDAFVALTDNSEANILACIAAKRFGLKKTIAQVENIDYIQLAESLDIGTIINKKLLAASSIYQYTLDADVHNVKCLTHVDAEVVELTPKEKSPITKSKIMDLRLPENIFIGGVIRNGEGIIANGNTQIMAGDDVIVFCLSSSFHKLDNLFN